MGRPFTVASRSVGAGEADAGLGAGEVDPLALSGAVPGDQAGQHRRGHEVRAHVVHVGEAPARGRLLGQSRDEGEAAACLDDLSDRLEVGVRAALPNPLFDTYTI